MRFPRNAKIFRGQLDTAPFASVFFVLVLMLLLTWRFAFTAGVPIDLPAVGRDLPGSASPIVVIVVGVDGQLHYENQMVQDEKKLASDLRNRVQQSSEPLDLAIHADRNVKLEPALRVAALARELGFRQVIFTGRGASVPENSALTPVPRK